MIFWKVKNHWISGAWQLNLKKFSEAGIDPYAIWSDEARTCGLSPWLSIRMNDIHNTDQKNHALHSDFWLAHPEFRRMPKANGRNCRMGIDAGTSVTDSAPRKSGVTKPVVIYGSSITQGASASHAGMAFVNHAGRIADVEMVNLGFSGAGRMEREVLEFIKQTDASCYVIDSAWNINSTKVAERWEPFVRDFHAAHPDVPIVFMEPCHEIHQKDKQKSSEIIRACYENLRREDPDRRDARHLVFGLSMADM